MTERSSQNNFDLIRLVLSLTVLIAHINTLTIPVESFSKIAQFFNAEIAVDSFFIVSGFLIFMSYEKTPSLKDYYLKRLRRVFPGYLVVIMISAIGLFILSSQNIEEYFSTPFFRYIFFNVLTLNFFQHSLPGVFEHNKLIAVNGALWTIKIEVMFYLLVPVIGYLLSRFNKIVIIFSIYILAIVYSLAMTFLAENNNSEIYHILERQLPSQLAFFIIGAGMYYYFDTFKKYAGVALLVASLLYFLSQKYSLYFLYPVSLSVIVIYLAMVLKYSGNWGKYGDLSFGIYIWHFPVIQVFIHFHLFEKDFYMAVSGLIVTVVLIAFGSWHLVEKPFLNRRSHYRKAEA